MQTETAQEQTGDEASDADLCRGFVDGSRQAKSDFVRRWESPMYRIALRIVGQSADAEEVRQTVLLRMLQRPESLPQPQNIAAWIRRCVINESLTLLRKRRRFASSDIAESERTEPPTDRSIEAAQLHAVLDQMPPEIRALLSLRFDEGLTVREIADVVDQPRSTVHAKLQSAIGTLRKKLNSN